MNTSAVTEKPEGGNLFDLSGKVALVTGGSRGIGEEIAHTLAQNGAHCIVSSRKQEACEQVAEAIRQSGGQASAIACHAGDMDSIGRLFETINSQFGRLDILINNAATAPHYGDILSVTPEAFQKTVDVNIGGYFFMTQAACELMRETGGGSIVNNASIGAMRPGAGQGIYCITKAAVLNMTRAFAAECGKYNIRVNSLLPGLTETKFAGAMLQNDQFYQKFVSGVPLGRHAQPREMAGAVLFMVSDAGSYMTGESIVIDGGATACGL